MTTPHIVQDVAKEMQARVFVDASITKQILEREGLANVRHLDVNVFRFQTKDVWRPLPLHEIIGITYLADPHFVQAGLWYVH